jgi:CDP-6-deoxy-D-xylo-4-hexulose-3-dehydrase
VIEYLDSSKIDTRLLFGGNLLKQPAFVESERRVVGSLINTNLVMEQTFWIGVWPGLDLSMLDYLIEKTRAALGR